MNHIQEFPWERVPGPGIKDHAFAGPVFLSRALVDRLVVSEIKEIIRDLRRVIDEKGLVQPVQRYHNRFSGETVCLVNRISEGAKKSRLFLPFEIEENDACLMMLDSEFRRKRYLEIRYNYYRV